MPVCFASVATYDTVIAKQTGIRQKAAGMVPQQLVTALMVSGKTQKPLYTCHCPNTVVGAIASATSYADADVMLTVARATEMLINACV